MRRQDRAVTGMDNIEAIIRRCEVCRLALSDTPYPYIVPMNFGYVRKGNHIALYFHCANEGTKLDLIRKNPHAAFEMDCSLSVLRGASGCVYTMAYESVIGQGKLSILRDDEKEEGLSALMRQYDPDQSFDFPKEAMARVTVLRLLVETITAKRNQPEDT